MHIRLGYKHVEAYHELADKFKTTWKNYFKFTVVRHPVSRFRSFYYDKIDPEGFQSINKFICDQFNENHPWFNNIHAVPQTSIVGCDPSLSDYVGRTESMGELEGRLKEVIPQFELQHLNISAYKRRHEPLITQSLTMLEKLYQKDFEVFGYSIE